jgi:hypothetical protein
MILYVNGDSHTAAAEAVNPHAFAEDDRRYIYMGRVPHPDNLVASWGYRLGQTLKAVTHIDAESASSNQRIMRTTRDWLGRHRNMLSRVLVLIQWSTWEREEWIIDGTPFQITASGTDDVPESHHDAYKQWVADLNWRSLRSQAHEKIWQFHLELQDQNIKHIFFNGNNHFGDIDPDDRHQWGQCYIDPYDPEMTYDQWLRRHGHDTVAPNSWHFGRSAHEAWSRFMLQYIINNSMIPR